MSTDASDDVIGIYQRHAATFDEQRSRSLFEAPWLDAFTDALPGPKVLDLGCGTGVPMAAALIEGGCAVTGIDGAAAMIDRARRRFPRARWQVADMRHLPPLGRFDGVIAWHSFFHLPPDDQPAMIARFGALLNPGGAVLFTSGTEHGHAMGQLGGEPLYHGSLDSAAYRDLLARAGLTVLRHVERDPDCGGATVWLAVRDADPAPPDENAPGRAAQPCR